MPNLCWFYVVPSYYPLWQVDSIWKTTQVKFDLGMNPYVQCIVSPKQYVILDIWAKLFIAHWDFWCSGHASCIMLNQCVSAEQAELFVEVQACQLILRDSGNGFALNISISNIMQDSGEPFYISLWSTYTFYNVFHTSYHYLPSLKGNYHLIFPLVHFFLSRQLIDEKMRRSLGWTSCLQWVWLPRSRRLYRA